MTAYDILRQVLADATGGDSRDNERLLRAYRNEVLGERPSRFTATSQQIDAWLREHFAEGTLLRYQQAIGNAAVTEAVADQRAQGEELPVGQTLAGLLFAAEWVDPAKGGGHYPSELINLTPKEG